MRLVMVCNTKPVVEICVRRLTEELFLKKFMLPLVYCGILPMDMNDENSSGNS